MFNSSMDFEGQKLAEKLMHWILNLTGASFQSYLIEGCKFAGWIWDRIRL
jgi:hypothetical protein